MKLIMTLLAKDEADIIEDNILFHSSMGVDGFIVTDNNSSDSTREIFQKYKEQGLILEIIDEPEITYNQSQWVNRMIEIAINKYHADWIIPSDADEFWYSPSLNIKNEINTFAEYNVIQIYHKNCVGEVRNKYYENLYFTQNHFPDFSCKKSKITHGWFKESGRRPKVIFKACDFKSIWQGQHDCEMHNKKTISANNLILYHFPIRCYSQFERKAINGGKAYLNYSNQNHGAHWREMYKDYLAGKLKDTYKRLCFANKLEELKSHGLVGIDTRFKNYMEAFVLQKTHKEQERKSKSLCKIIERFCLRTSSLQPLKIAIFQLILKKNAYTLLHNSELDEAEAIAQNITANNPNMAWAYYVLAKVQWARNEGKLALENIEKAINLEPRTKYFQDFKRFCLRKHKGK